MQTHTVVSQEEWLAARKALLLKEKEFTQHEGARIGSTYGSGSNEKGVDAMALDYRFVEPPSQTTEPAERN